MPPLDASRGPSAWLVPLSVALVVSCQLSVVSSACPSSVRARVRASASVHDLERRGDDDRAGGGQLIEIAQAGQAELAVPVHDAVIRERRIERPRLPCVGPDRLHTNTQDIPILASSSRRRLVEAGAVRAVGFDVEKLVSICPLTPAGA